MVSKRAKSSATEHFTKMIRSSMETPAWRALSPVAQALYPWLKLEWRGPKFNNNGKIQLSVRQAAERLGVTRNTASKAFHELQEKGFIVMTTPAHLGLAGYARSPCFEITELVKPNSGSPIGRKLYNDWRVGADYPCHKTMANNPTGNNGQKKTFHDMSDNNVIKLGQRS